MRAEPLQRLLRFTAVGLGALAAYAAIVTLLTGLGFGPAWLASGTAYALAAVWSYVGHRRISFRSDSPHEITGPRFAVVTLTGQGLAVAIPALVTDVAGLPQLWATTAVCIVCPAASFVLHSRFVFADVRQPSEAP